ncbi:MAG: hypothetical protein ACYSVY_05835 [Planctomycetota bacterium]
MARYGERHRLQRITDFPAGISPPKKARIYARSGHFIVQWWDPAAQGSLCERVNGDLVDALAVARDIDRRLEDLRTSGRVRRRLKHRALVGRFAADLRRRADAGEIAAATVDRYVSALAHYLACTEMAEIRKSYRYAVNVDRQFALRFAAYLDNQMVSPNGHANARRRKMVGQRFVLDATRALFEWAADPLRGGCLPAAFQNPFRRKMLKRREPAADPTGEPDITLDMAIAFVESCDDPQLALFAPIILYGLRASEPVYLFREHLSNGVLRVPCLPMLDYRTKGVCEKKLPLLDEITRLLTPDNDQFRHGLLYLRRSAAQGQEAPPLMGWSLPQLADEYVQRCARSNDTTAAAKERIRVELILEAGGLSYDRINGEFRRIARQLQWPTSATLKGFRHLFSTVTANGGMPDHERRYLMGHAPERAAIRVYTHMNHLANHYREVAESQYSRVLDVIRERIG